MSISYKKTKDKLVITKFLDKINDNNSQIVNDKQENEIEDIHFEIQSYFQLLSPQERIRYFVIYEIDNICNLNLIRIQLLKDIDEILVNDIFIVFKAIEKLFYYKTDFIPNNNIILTTILNSVIDFKFSEISAKLIVLYYGKYENCFSKSDILKLLVFSILNEKEIRPIIWQLITNLVFLNNFTIPYQNIIEMLDIYDNLNYNCKNILTNLIFALQSCHNIENNKTIKSIFFQKESLMKHILICGINGENKITIQMIFQLISKYENFDFYKDIIDVLNKS